MRAEGLIFANEKMISQIVADKAFVSGRLMVFTWEMVTLNTLRHSKRLTAMALAMASGSALMTIRA